MEATIPLLFAATIGFTHAFEVDHLLAVSNIVTKRNRILHAVKDGVYWGLGHTSTILILGLLVLAGKATFINSHGNYLELIVGVMLILIGIIRLTRLNKGTLHSAHANGDRAHKEALGVGLIHGLAGSGAMILVAMTEMHNYVMSMAFLLVFGIGSIAGMLLAAGILSLPFSRRFRKRRWIILSLTWISSLLCIIYGGVIIYTQLTL